ncbi:MAG TPA: hypothetical protein VGH28_12145 [Polyangiaceae bacterium]|jgi:hypothetical protein
MIFRVFAQADTPRLQLAAWQRNAERFFSETFDVEEPSDTSARVVIATARRVVTARSREEADLRDALADEPARSNGLYDLAERRCRVVFEVERQAADDRAGLLLAAAIASVALGPILGERELFGVRTAREKLEALAR